MRKYAKGCTSGLLTLVGIVLALIVLLNLAFRIILVDGVSMQPTLSDGDWILVCRVIDPKAGDIVVTKPNNAQNARLIKRLIGLPGDTVDIDYDTGKVTVNGRTLEETYLADSACAPGDVTFPLTVPEGQVFLLGDNRTNSLDSRYIEVGCIPMQDILGPVVLRLLRAQSLPS